MESKYRCVYCLTACNALYRDFGGLASIQLIRCSNCKSDVDPYCEREWLLVLLDCILLRPEAYRHTLINSIDDIQSFLLNRIGFSGSVPFKCQPMITLMVLTACAYGSLLHSADPLDEPIRLLSSFIWATSLLTVTCVSTLLVSGEVTNGRRRRRLVWAICLPCLGMSLLSLLVQVWEPSQEVRQLGILLMLVYQFMSLSSIGNSPGRVAMALLFSWFVREFALVPIFVNATRTKPSCIGLELVVSPMQQSICIS